MAGRGVAPKDPSQRRRYNQPARGEWVDLEPLEAPILREYTPLWEITREMWDAWRDSPVTSQYGPEDIALAEELAARFYTLGESTRLRMIDSLGLSPKGKRDLRWRTPAEVQTLKAQEKGATVTRLHAAGKRKP